jgi:hypothetical protein
MTPVLLAVCAFAAAQQLPPPPQLVAVEPPNDRIHVNSIQGIRVSTAVPSEEETRAIFGQDLYRRNIQPVWIRIENLRDERAWFLPTGLDEDYFTPIEASYLLRGRIAILNPSVNTDMYGKSMRVQVEAGAARSGYVFTRVDEGTKSFNVDVMTPSEHFLMSFYVPVPGLRLDHYEVDLGALYNEDEIVDVDLQGLIDGLEALPCCVRDKKDENDGDPLNFAIVGSIQDAYYGFMRAGWDETETTYGSSLWQMLKSSLGGSEYRYSPVSALYVFGRAQDAALQKARSNINQRNHLRLWLTPMRFEGKPVWIGQISRDIGVRFTAKTITTHKIDPDVDETREYLIEDLAYAQSLARIGFVGGVGAASYDEPRGNLTGDPYFTDGLRAVLFLSARPTAISDIEILDLGAFPEAR